MSGPSTGWALAHISAPIGAFGWLALAVFGVVTASYPDTVLQWPPHWIFVALLVGGSVMVLQPHIALFALRSSRPRITYLVDMILMLLLLGCEGLILKNLSTLVMDPTPLLIFLSELQLWESIPEPKREEVTNKMMETMTDVVLIQLWVVLGVTVGIAVLHLVAAALSGCAALCTRASSSDTPQHRSNTTNRTSFEYRQGRDIPMRSMDRDTYQNKYDKLYE